MELLIGIGIGFIITIVLMFAYFIWDYRRDEKKLKEEEEQANATPKYGYKDIDRIECNGKNVDFTYKYYKDNWNGSEYVKIYTKIKPRDAGHDVIVYMKDGSELTWCSEKHYDIVVGRDIYKFRCDVLESVSHPDLYCSIRNKYKKPKHNQMKAYVVEK